MAFLPHIPLPSVSATGLGLHPESLDYLELTDGRGHYDRIMQTYSYTMYFLITHFCTFHALFSKTLSCYYFIFLCPVYNIQSIKDVRKYEHVGREIFHFINLEMIIKRIPLTLESKNINIYSIVYHVLVHIGMVFQVQVPIKYQPI